MARRRTGTGATSTASSTCSRPRRPTSGVLADEERAGRRRGARAGCPSASGETLLAHEVSGRTPQSLAAELGLHRRRGRRAAEPHPGPAAGGVPAGPRAGRAADRPVPAGAAGAVRRRPPPPARGRRRPPPARVRAVRPAQPAAAGAGPAARRRGAGRRSAATPTSSRRAQAARELAARLGFSADRPDRDRDRGLRDRPQHRAVRRARARSSSSCSSEPRRGHPGRRPRHRARASPTSSGRCSDGYSTYHGLGLGLPGARRLMDEFDDRLRGGPRHDGDDDQMATRRMTHDRRTADTATERRPADCRRGPTGRGPAAARSWSPTCASTGPSCGRSGPAGSSDAHLLQAMTPQEMAAETTSVYDNYVEVLETGSVEALQHYARDLSERIIPRGVETHEVVGIVLLLRDVLARSLFEKYQRDFAAAQPGAGRLRAGRQPDRQHRRGQLRRRARAGHPPAAGRDPRAVHAGAAGPGAAADPADHRGARQRAGPAADRAAAQRHPHPPGEGRRHRHHRRRRTSTRRSPTTWCRPSTPPG